MKRRQFFQFTAGTTLIYFAGCSHRKYKTDSLEQSFETLNPIDRLSPLRKQHSFSGDNPTSAHRVLWDKSDYVKKTQKISPESHHKIVIVGGGMSGLLSAHFLKAHKPVIL